MKINIITGMILAALSPLLFAGTVADAFAGPLPSPQAAIRSIRPF